MITHLKCKKCWSSNVENITKPNIRSIAEKYFCKTCQKKFYDYGDTLRIIGFVTLFSYTYGIYEKYYSYYKLASCFEFTALISIIFIALIPWVLLYLKKKKIFPKKNKINQLTRKAYLTLLTIIFSPLISIDLVNRYFDSSEKEIIYGNLIHNTTMHKFRKRRPKIEAGYFCCKEKSSMSSKESLSYMILPFEDKELPQIKPHQKMYTQIILGRGFFKIPYVVNFHFFAK